MGWRYRVWGAGFGIVEGDRVNLRRGKVNEAIMHI